MMKISDPIMFGHCVSAFYKDALKKHASTLERLGTNVNNGLGDVYEKIASLPEAERKVPLYVCMYIVALYVFIKVHTYAWSALAQICQKKTQRRSRKIRYLPMQNQNTITKDPVPSDAEPEHNHERSGTFRCRTRTQSTPHTQFVLIHTRTRVYTCIRAIEADINAEYFVRSHAYMHAYICTR
jgi:hypothetical protein